MGFGDPFAPNDENELLFESDRIELNIEILANANPWLATQPDLINELATSGLDPQTLQTQATRMLGDQHADRLAQLLPTLNESTQRSVFSTLTQNAQMSLWEMGYEVPDGYEENWIDTGLSAVNTIVGTALGGVARLGGKIPGAKQVAGPAFNGLIWLSDQPARLYRTWRQMEPWEQAVMAASFVAGAGGVALGARAGMAGRAVLGSQRLGQAAASIGGQSAAFGRTSVAGLMTTGGLATGSVTGLAINPSGYVDAFRAAADGERLFTSEARQAADLLSRDETVQSLARDIAHFLPRDEFVAEGASLVQQIAQEVAGVRDSTKPEMYQTAAQRFVAEHVVDAGDPMFTNYVQALDVLLREPKFREIVQTYQNGKISPGRDTARMLGLKPGSAAYSFVSASADAVWVWTLDPFLLATPAFRHVRYASRTIDDVGTPLVGSGWMFRRKPIVAPNAVERRVELSKANVRGIQKVDQDIVDALNANNSFLLPRQYESSWDVMREYFRRKEQISARGEILQPITLDDLYGFYRDADGIRLLGEGLGQIPGLPQAVVSTKRNVLNQNKLRQALRDVRISLTNPDFERSIAAIAKKNGIDVDELRLANDVSENLGVDYAVPQGAIPDDLGTFGTIAGEALSKIGIGTSSLGDGRRSLGNFVDSVATMANTEPYVILFGPGAEESIRRVVSSMGVTARMPFAVREQRIATILAQNTPGARRLAMLGFLDEFFNVSGIKYTERGAQLHKEFVEKFRQGYGYGGYDDLLTSGNSEFMIRAGLQEIDQAPLLAIPPIKLLTRAVRDEHLFNKIMEITNEGAWIDNAMSIWRPAVLLRLGFVPRAAGEEALAWLARGTQGNIVQELFARKVAKYEDLLEVRRQLEQGMPISQLPPELRAMTDRRTFKYVYPEVENLLTQSGAEVGRMRRVAGRSWNSVADMLAQNWVNYIRDLRKFKGVPAIKALLKRTEDTPFLQTLLFGRKNSWSYFGANGIDPAFVQSARRFTDKHAATFSRSISASSHNEYNLDVGDPTQAFVVTDNGIKNGQLVVQTAVGGVRQRVTGNSEPARVAYHAEVTKPLANPELGRVLATNSTNRPPLTDPTWNGARLAETLQNFTSQSPGQQQIMLELSMFEPDRWRVIEGDFLRSGDASEVALAEAMRASYVTGEFDIDTFVSSLRESGRHDQMFISEVEQFWNLMEQSSPDVRGYAKTLIGEHMMAPADVRTPLRTLAGATEDVPSSARRVYIGKAGGINSYTIRVDDAGNLIITPTNQYQWRGPAGPAAISTSVNPLHSASYALGSIVSDQPAYFLGNVFELDADFLLSEFGTTYDNVVSQPTTYRQLIIDPPERGAYLTHVQNRPVSSAEEIAVQPNYPMFSVIPDEPASVVFNAIGQTLLDGRQQLQRLLPPEFTQAYADMSRIVGALEDRIMERYIQIIRTGTQVKNEFRDQFYRVDTWLSANERAALREAVFNLAQTKSVSDETIATIRNNTLNRLRETPDLELLENWSDFNLERASEIVDPFGDATTWVAQYDQIARPQSLLSELINNGADLTDPELIARLDTFIDQHIYHVLRDVKSGSLKYAPEKPWESWDGPFNEIRRQFSEAGFNPDGSLNNNLYQFGATLQYSAIRRIMSDPQFQALYRQRDVIIPAGKWRAMPEDELLNQFELLRQHPDIGTGTGSLNAYDRGETFIDQLMVYPGGETAMSTVTQRVFNEIKKIADRVENVDKPAINNMVNRINAALTRELADQALLVNIMFDGNAPSLQTLNYAWFDPQHKPSQRAAWDGQIATSNKINADLIPEGVVVSNSVDDLNDAVIRVITDTLIDELGPDKYQRLLAYFNLRGDDAGMRRSHNTLYLEHRILSQSLDASEIVSSPLVVADALTQFINGQSTSDLFNLEYLLSDALDEVNNIVKDEYLFTLISGGDDALLSNVVNRWMNFLDDAELRNLSHGRFLSELPDSQRLAAMLLMHELKVPAQIGTRPFNGMDNITEIERMLATRGMGTLPRRTERIHTDHQSLRDQLVADYTAALYRPENQDIVNASVFNISTDGRTVAQPVPAGIERYYFPEFIDGAVLEEELRLLIQNSPGFAYNVDFVSTRRVSADQIPDELVEELSARLLMRNQSGLATFSEFVGLPLRQQISLLEPFVRQAIAMPSAVGQVLNRTGVGNARLAEFVTRAIGGLDADTPLAGLHQIDIGTSKLDSAFPDAEVAKRSDRTDFNMIELNRTAVDRIEYATGGILPNGQVGVSREEAIKNWAERAVDSTMHVWTKGSRELFTVRGQVYELLPTGEYRLVPEGTVISEYGIQLFDSPNATANRVELTDRKYFDIDLQTSDEYQWALIGPAIVDYWEGVSGRRRVVPYDSVIKESGQVLPDAEYVPLKHSRVEHVNFVDKFDRPNTVLAREYVLPSGKTFDKLTDWSTTVFNDVFGPMIDGIVRTPMAFDNYHHAFVRNLTYMDALLTKENKAAINGLRSIVDDEVFSTLRGSYASRLTDANADLVATIQAFDWVDEDVLFAWRNNGLSFDEVQTAIQYEVFVQVNSGELVPARYMDFIRDSRNNTGRNYTLKPRRFPEGIDGEAVANLTQTDIDALAAARRNLEFVDDISMQRAVNDTVPFIDSSSKRSLFSVRASNFMPFWYAEENFIKRWIRGAAAGVFGVDQIVKAQYLYNGLKNVGILQEENGELYFVYPGSVLLNQMISMVIPGAGLEQTGSAVRSPAESLLPGINPDAGRPGLGPMISLPIKFFTNLFAELQPEYADEMLQTQRSFLGDIGTQQDWWAQIVPTQLRRALTAVGANLRVNDEWVLETYASSTNSAMAALFATDQGIDTSSTPDQRQLFVDRVRNHSRIHTVVKALWGFVVPGTPQIFESTESPFSLEALTGAGLQNPAAVFGASFRNYIEIYGIEEGTYKFLEDHPDSDLESIVNPEAYTVSKTQTTTGAPLPATDVAMNWYGDNARWLADFPNAGVWLVPDKGTDQTSRFAFSQQFISKLRVMRTPEEFLNQMLFKNAAPAYFQLQDDYYALREQYKDNYEALQILDNEYRKERELILATNPVFAEMLSTNRSEARQETIRQMRVAVNDPSAPDSPYLEPIRLMVEAFDFFDVTIKGLGDSRSRDTLQKKENVRLVFENWVAGWLNENPELEPLWQTVYEPESNLR